jgi:RND family efflux transporter MFP subunit
MRSRTINVTTLAVALSTLLVFTGCGSRGSNTNASSTSAQPTTVDIKTAQAITRQIPTYFEATGNLASDAQTDVAPVVGGKVIEVNFDVGSYVAKGSVLVRMDDRDARIRLEQALAQVEQQKKAVGTAIAALRQAQIRLGVKDGEVFDIETFSQVKSTKANLVLAEKELARAEKLYATGDVSRSILDQRRSQRDALLGQLDEARSNAAVAVNQIDQARKAISDMVILAPISGYVSERVADPGEFLTPNAPNTKVATIVRTSSLRLRIDVPEASIGKVAVGQGISMQTSAYPERTFAGTVVRILPNLNTTARTLIVEAEVPNGDGLLKPGQFATVRVTQSKPENAVMIPASAIKTEGDLNKVYVVKDGAVRERLIQTGLLENDLIQVKQGIAEGETIATSNLNELFDGIFVRQVN